jgi:predicted ABC-type ATPase
MRAMTEPIRVLILNGPVGVGKSTIANTVSEVLEQRGVPHALVEMDYLAAAYPRPDDDPFHQELAVRNLAAVWANFRAAGGDHGNHPARHRHAGQHRFRPQGDSRR